MDILGKEFSTYRVGTVANSTSTMHKIQSKPITLEDFEFNKEKNLNFTLHFQRVVNTCEFYRTKFLETGDKDYWRALIEILPESYLQKRTITMSYENLLAICSKNQRRFHKLNEWSGQDDSSRENFIAFARKLPYAQELLFLDELEEPKITITKKEYDNLIDNDNFLSILEANGVDNWEGYGFCIDELKDQDQDKN